MTALEIIKASKDKRGYYSFVTKNLHKQYTGCKNLKSNENEVDVINDLIKKGYAVIRCYYVTTYVRGYYNTVIYYK